MSASDLDAWLQTLADNSKPTQERRDALSMLGVARFSDMAFAEREAEYRAACRAASTQENQDQSLRVEVLAGLCMDKDRETQARLIAGLEDPSQALAPPDKALKFLGYDPHPGVFPIARRYAESSPDPRTQQEALRLLELDPEAADLLAKILADRGQDPESRVVASSALSSQAPDRHVALAKAIVDDPADDEYLRACLREALEG